MPGDRRRPTARSASAARGTVSATSQRRFQARARGRRRLAWRPILLTLLVLALLGGAGWLVLVSDVFGVKTIEVRGTSAVSAGSVSRASGVRLGTPLARVDLGVVERAVQASSPWVKSVSAARQWPSTLRIVVAERVPAAVRVTPGKPPALVDASGVVLQTSPPASALAGLPVVVVPVAVPDGAAPELAALGLDILRVLPAAVAERVLEVQAAGRDALSLKLRGGATVVWGGPEQGETKARVLTALLEQKAQVYDVSAPNAPAIR